MLKVQFTKKQFNKAVKDVIKQKYQLTPVINTNEELELWSQWLFSRVNDGAFEGMYFEVQDKVVIVGGNEVLINAVKETFVE